MTSRFDVERGVVASQLPKLARLLMFVLLTHADNDTAEIRERSSPSLTDLARETGMNRSTVVRTLRRLDVAGWVVRTAPPIAESRKGARTRYRMAIPVGAPETQQVGADDAQLGAGDTQARCTCHLGVVAQDSKPKCHVHPFFALAPNAPDTQRASSARNGQSRNGSRPAGWFDDAVTFVTEQLTLTTRKTYDRRDITDSITGFLSGKPVTNPLAYIRRCATENPRQFEPTPGPARYVREQDQTLKPA
jgi:hypothetical protein